MHFNPVLYPPSPRYHPDDFETCPACGHLEHEMAFECNEDEDYVCSGCIADGTRTPEAIEVDRLNRECDIALAYTAIFAAIDTD